jgi:hypothetical protein
MVESGSHVDLRYPLYLDVPMMISFLAALEDGVSYEENIQRRAGGRRAVRGEASAGTRLPSFLSLLSFDLRGSLSGESDTNESEELQLVKRHSEASLFNRLRSALHEDGGIKVLDEEISSPGEVVPGMIIEANGVIVRNPLDELLAFVERLRPFIEQATPSPQGRQQQRAGGGRQSRGQGNPSSDNNSPSNAPRQQPDTLTILDWVREDLEASDMTDIDLQINQPVFPRVILTLSKDFGTGRTIDSLLGAEVGVIGKVSVVKDSGEPVSLLRRSILGYMPVEQRESMFTNFGAGLPFVGMVEELEVSPPLVQVMPLSIFI